MQFGFSICPYCAHHGGFVYVHGHYQCKHCHQNVMPCCSGEQEFSASCEAPQPELLTIKSTDEKSL